MDSVRQHTAASVPSRDGRRRRASVWAVAASTAAAAALLTWLAVRPLRPLHAAYSLPWWVIAVGFLLAEVFVVHLHFRRDAYTHVLDELPLIAGMLLSSPWGVVAARVIGSGVALAAHRRQPPIKLVYNLALVAMYTAVAVIVFRACLGGADPLSARGWLAALAATTAQAIIGCTWIVMAMALTGGRAQLGGLPRLLMLVLDIEPCPSVGQGGSGAGVLIYMADTGLLADAASHSWLAGVVGDPDPLPPLAPDGTQPIPPYTGHGTFVAGITRCMAPAADVIVTNAFSIAGSTLESDLVPAWSKHSVSALTSST